MVIQSVRSNVGGICNLVLFMGLFAISVSPVGAIPINTSGGGASIKYPINIACECIFTLYVDGVYVGEGNKENYDPVNWPFGISEWNNTKKYYPVIYENEPKIVAFNGIGGQYTVFPNGFIMDMNDGKDYTKYKEWKCKDFSKTTEKTPPANWFTYDYDDSGWDISTSYGANYQNNSFQIFESPRDFISLNAEWLWTKDNADANIYCRKKNMDTVVLTSAPMVTTTIVPPPVTTIATMVTSAPVVTSVPVVKTTVAPLVTSVPVVKTTVAPLVTSVPVVKTTVAHTPVSTTIHPPVTTTVTHLPVTTTVTPLLTSVPVIKTTIVHPPVTTIIAHPPVTTTITHPPVTTSAPVSTTIHHPVRTHPPTTTTVAPLVTSVPVVKTTVTHPPVTTTVTHPPVTTSAPVSTTIHHHVRTHPPTTTTVAHLPVTTTVAHLPVTTTVTPLLTSVPVIKTTIVPPPVTTIIAHPPTTTTITPLVTSVPVVKTTVAHTPVSTTIHPPVTTTVTHLPVTTTVTPLLTSVPVIKTTIVHPPVTTIIAHPPVTTTITHPPVTTSAPVSTTIHHPVRTHPPVTTTITHPPVTTAVTSVPVIKTTVAHPLVTTTITPLVVPPSVPPPIHPSPPINIKIVINNIKYSQGVSDKQLAHLLENIKFYNHPQYQSKYRNDHLDNNNLYRTVLNARLDLIRHYEVLLRHFERIERLKHESRDEDTDYKIPRHSSDDSTSKSNIIQSMIKLNSRIKHIEDSIHFIKGNHKYLLLHILKTLKQQYKKDTMKIFNI